ncbi:hypothetical protein BDQ17DRAFT_1536433 [Cyathus striatus]|nr:hypothetical protein BDQ17DRAFT_1536433 [Cyathus striatus]
MLRPGNQRIRLALPTDYPRRTGCTRLPRQRLPSEQCSIYSPIRTGFRERKLPKHNVPLPSGWPDDTPLLITWLYPHGKYVYTPNSSHWPMYSSKGYKGHPRMYLDDKRTSSSTPTGRIRVHPDLMPNNLDWNILQKPMIARYQMNGYSSDTVRPQFYENASIPGVKEIVLRIGRPSLVASWTVPWGPIRIGGDDRGSITIKDVLQAIFDYFHTPLTSREVDAVRSSANRDIVYEGFVRRLNTSKDLCRSFSNALYPLRIDILNGCTYFKGVRTNDSAEFREGHVEMFLDLGHW